MPASPEVIIDLDRPKSFRALNLTHDQQDRLITSLKQLRGPSKASEFSLGIPEVTELSPEEMEAQKERFVQVVEQTVPFARNWLDQSRTRESTTSS